MTKRIGNKCRTHEFKDKQKSLALFLFNLACNESISSIEGLKKFGSYSEYVGAKTILKLDKTYYKNYMADANDILRSNPHLLGLGSRERMGL